MEASRNHPFFLFLRQFAFLVFLKFYIIMLGDYGNRSRDLVYIVDSFIRELNRLIEAKHGVFSDARNIEFENIGNVVLGVNSSSKTTLGVGGTTFTTYILNTSQCKSGYLDLKKLMEKALIAHCLTKERLICITNSPTYTFTVYCVNRQGDHYLKRSEVFRVFTKDYIEEFQINIRQLCHEQLILENVKYVNSMLSNTRDSIPMKVNIQRLHDISERVIKPPPEPIKQIYRRPQRGHRSHVDWFGNKHDGGIPSEISIPSDLDEDFGGVNEEGFDDILSEEPDELAGIPEPAPPLSSGYTPSHVDTLPSDIDLEPVIDSDLDPAFYNEPFYPQARVVVPPTPPSISPSQEYSQMKSRIMRDLVKNVCPIDVEFIGKLFYLVEHKQITMLRLNDAIRVFVNHFKNRWFRLSEGIKAMPERHSAAFCRIKGRIPPILALHLYEVDYVRVKNGKLTFEAFLQICLQYERRRDSVDYVNILRALKTDGVLRTKIARYYNMAPGMHKDSVFARAGKKFQHIVGTLRRNCQACPM